MEEKRLKMNTLYFGDNLDILRDKIADNFVDLIYLDPPFKSGRTYNIIFHPESNNIKGATAQIETFGDTWKWGDEAAKNYYGLIQGTITKEKANPKLIELMKAMRSYLGESSIMAYLCMMAPRLLEMRRVLKPTGSIYLHCDPTASHYLKLLMDAIFGIDNFQNEVVWGYRIQGVTKKRWAKKHEILLFYTKSQKYIFNPQKEKIIYQKSFYDTKIDNEGKYYRDVYIRDIWDDIKALISIRKELVGYPTQKPEALLERIIKANSNEGDIILDPFCGCGTVVVKAEKLKRRWIGIDITYLAIDVVSKRFREVEKEEGMKINFAIDGEPKDVYSAKKLAEKNAFQFQIWCISRIENAIPSQRKTGDKGVDGIIYFIDPRKKSQFGKGIIQVKGTENVNPSMVRDLKGTLITQEADFGVLITFRGPTQGMVEEATSEYFTPYTGKNIPRIQFLTLDDLFNDPISVKLPTDVLSPYGDKKLIIERDLHLFD
ncbi:MAG: restriction endonuclease [Candidatus Stahlbacteria bacterium]|nr:restriction endonuclease [Candidatus Stahlbacteria bacterium]